MREQPTDLLKGVFVSDLDNQTIVPGKDNPIRAEKRRKLHQLKEANYDPFPHDFKRTEHCGDLKKQFSSLEDGETKEETSFTVAGRLMTKRDMGKASFFTIQDQSGQLQIYLRKQELPEEQVLAFSNLDIGDFVGITGFVFKTKKGEVTLHTKNFSLICKTLEPLPEKFHGLTDVELKYRYRHLDLIMNPKSRKVFEMRSKIIREIRSFLDNRGFLEVETPILQPIYGGAAAHPFETHHRALDMTLYLKISPELYLKRLIVGGFEKVYEIGKTFRNEGIDRTHNPEFTLLEFYEAYTDYNYQMQQFEELIATVAEKVLGTTTIQFAGKEIDLKPPWRRLSVYDGLKEYGKFDPEKLNQEELFAKLKEIGSDIQKKGGQLPSHGEMVMEAFEILVEPHLWEPTMVIDHPKEISPLTKSHREHPHLVERFEPFIANMEVGNSYTELNDPEDQRARLKAQEEKRVIDEEAHPMDEDFMHAIDVGMPPTGGVGVGIERIVMLFTGQETIRDILLFPTMKHKN